MGLDGAGAGLSALCLVHCLGLPLVSSALPAIAGLAEAEWVDLAILALAAPVAIGSLLVPKSGLRPSAPVAGLGTAGLFMLALGAFGPAAMEHWASIAGGLALASAHLLNWRRRHIRLPTCQRG
ncbi:MerC domain-containing protein [Phenylobacterium sp.]|jgi:hypothetical protein|uniref:MerC domain-containing protein n=1 Tax=Phenylobacterium sp. TaxID=1871053 RepID=UPI002E30084C|nr:MerC domain-containing protein [Phenylobacterium sp.]